MNRGRLLKMNEHMSIEYVDICVEERRDCRFCDERTNGSVMFSKNHPNSWKYLEIGESAHPECYIQKCVHESLRKLQNE